MTAEAQPQRTQWGLVVLLGSLTAMGPVAIDMYLPSLPAIGAGLHASAGETQATVSAFLAGMAVGQLFYGPAADRLGRRPPILLGTVIFVAASIACGFAASPAMLIGGRFVQALGACAGGVVARAVVRDRFGHTETARMLSLLMLIMGLAPILAPLLGGALLGLGGWRLNFWFMAAFGVAVGLAALFRLKESRSEETTAHAQTESPLQAYLALLREPRLVGYALAGALNGATIFTYIASSPDLLIKTYGIPPAAFGWVFGLNAVGIIGSNQVNRFLLRRRTVDQVLARASLVAVGIAILLMIAAVTGIGERWSVLPLLLVLLSSYGFLQGNTMAGALNVDPRRAGAISALMGGVSFGTGALASAAAGVLHDGTPRPMALVMLVALAGSAAALRLLALPKRRSAAG
ncbi:MAG: drug resistance transporter, Bcr/CflA subfamily [Phenylobacterium sp.]|jgi:DHA1 family bicyclomycin/chloramphenicol resistance-like MFS transporter|uniref:multidrug effflux MFS transporter n=1 Tax=Phenylobacterium sp. TaxID=1871053 RepID=UPI002606E449|nr:multidrug effflux MFS transporter [Phenylobacterium sp.]MDB5464202.1 drug resistance transporter, Bcr/CflA subfamily [Phenylobacterium sp.]MDB5498149.1 drug resistance transporter, Bcr/CflA subfamily [Phenylobacterium sp.]